MYSLTSFSDGYPPLSRISQVSVCQASHLGRNSSACGSQPISSSLDHDLSAPCFPDQHSPLHVLNVFPGKSAPLLMWHRIPALYQRRASPVCIGYPDYVPNPKSLLPWDLCNLHEHARYYPEVKLLNYPMAPIDGETSRAKPKTASTRRFAISSSAP